jgi:hypothetical protein
MSPSTRTARPPSSSTRPGCAAPSSAIDPGARGLNGPSFR